MGKSRPKSLRKSSDEVRECEEGRVCRKMVLPMRALMTVLALIESVHEHQILDLVLYSHDSRTQCCRCDPDR